MNMIRKLFIAGFAAAAVVGFSVSQSNAQERGGTLVMLVQPEPPTLASYVSTSGPVGQVATKVFDGLLEYDFDLEPQPSLAESWTVSDDGKTITFNLRQDVTFHDGEPFTSADVQFSIMDVLKQRHPRGPLTFKEVTEIETPDDHTAILHLANPAPYLLMGLSSYESPMIPKHIYGEGTLDDHPNANEPIGTGAFTFVEWRRGQYMRFDRNANYWKEGQPYLDRIVASFIPDSSTRTAALELEEAHIAGFGAVPYSDVNSLDALPHLEATTSGYQMQAPIVQLDFNTRREPFDNQKVRQAISYAIDRQFVIDNVWFGFGKAATGPISSVFAVTGMYTDDVREYNVENGQEIAEQLLDEAGYPRDDNGIRFSIVHDITPYGEEWQRYGEYTREALRNIGIEVRLRTEDVPTWLRRIYTDYDFDLTNNWIQTLADPVIGAHRLYHSDQIRPGTVFVNGSGWSSPETDELMDRAAIEVDQDRRNAIYHELQQKLVEAAPYVWVHELQFATVYNNNFQDLIVSPLGIYTSFSEAHQAQ
jgi:peptide/nickel transport system substrate-binding protein